jgi:hypothetical protein
MANQVLIDELANDPLTRGYSGMTDEQAANSLNTKNRTASTVGVGQIVNWLFETPAATQALRTGQDNTGLTNSVRGICYNFLRLDVAPFQSVTLTQLTGAADSLQSAAVFTAGQRNGLVALANNQISRAEELGLPFVVPGDVYEARL